MTAVEQDIEKATHVTNIMAANGLRICYGSQQLLINSDDADWADVKIYQANGQLVSQQSVSLIGGKARVDVSSLGRGLYVARAISNKGTGANCKFER